MSKISTSLLLLSLASLLACAVTGCAFRRVTRDKDLIYQQSQTGLAVQKLDVYSPKRAQGLQPVLLFIHGGNWNSGSRKLYAFLGNRFARKGVVTVILSYPLSPAATYQQMAEAVAAAVKWTDEHIRRYGGDPDRIFLSGHSAGGHLAALVALDTSYLNQVDEANSIKGIILIDAAGLDMYGYLQKQKYPEGHTYLNTFTTDSAHWKVATPLYHLRPNMPPMLIYRGEETYPSIIKSTQSFIAALKAYDPNPNYHVLKGKKHIPMITQLLWTWNPLYKEMKTFMQVQQ